MSGRRHYLVSYDVSDNRRRDKIFEILKDHGDHAQYSVFFCELTRRELSSLRRLLREHVNHREDQVLFVDLGQATNPLKAGMEVLGKAYDPPVRNVVI